MIAENKDYPLRCNGPITLGLLLKVERDLKNHIVLIPVDENANNILKYIQKAVENKFMGE